MMNPKADAALSSSKHTRGRRKFILILAKALAIVLLLFSGVAAYAYAPAIETTVTKLIPVARPKPISQSSKILPSTIQKAVENLARQQIKNQEAIALLPEATPVPSSQENPGLLQTLRESVQEVT